MPAIFTNLFSELFGQFLKKSESSERLFELLRSKFPNLDISGSERAGRDIRLGEVFEDYPKPDRPAGNRNAANELLGYANGKDLRTKIIFVNDGPGLLLGSMWDDYAYIEDSSDDIIVVTLRMIMERITMDWLKS